MLHPTPIRFTSGGDFYYLFMHNHHIIPKYEGGTDDPSNLVELSITQHAMWHFAEWQRKGNVQDKLAWQGLAGIVGKEEIVAEATRLSKRFSGKQHKEESKRKNSETHRKKFEEDKKYRENKIKNAKEFLGKSKHKRNPSMGTATMSGPNKRQYMRRHWKKEVWDAVKTAWENRTSFHWGKSKVARQNNVSVKTVENMLKLIAAGVDWHTATNWEGQK